MGLLDYLTSPSGGGLLDFLNTSPSFADRWANVPNQTAIPLADAKTNFSDRFNALPTFPTNNQPSPLDNAQWPAGPAGAPQQAQPIAVGNYQMPRIGSSDLYAPLQTANAALPPNAQPTQGQLPQGTQQVPEGPETLPPALGGNSIGGNFGAGLQSFVNTPGGLLSKFVGGANALVTGQRSDPVGMQQQNLKAQYDSLRAALQANGETPQAAASKAMVAVMNPEAAKTIIPELFTNREKWSKIGIDPTTGQELYGFVNERDQTINGKPASAQPTAQSSIMGDPNLTGDAYLQSLPEGFRSQVKAIVEGRMQPPSGFALKSPQIQALMRAAAQYEPGFDLTKWASRSATAKDFASGQAAKNVTSLNTVVGHLADLKEKADALGNSSIPAINTVKNFANNATGGAEVNNFNLARNAVADELAKVFKGSGISDHEIEQWKGTLNAAQSPEQLKGAVKTAISLMESRLYALKDQHDRGMNTSIEPRDLLTDKSKAALAKVEAWANGGSAKPEAKAGSISEGATATNPQTGQKIVFKGGKWVPAQ